MDTIYISGHIIGTKNASRNQFFCIFLVSRLHKIGYDGKIYTKTDLNMWTSIR